MKIRTELLCRRIIPTLVVFALFVGMLGTVLSPQKAYAAYYSYTDLHDSALLPTLLEDLKGTQTTLTNMGLSPTDAAPTQSLIDRATAQVQTAIETMIDTPAWIASANKAIEAVGAAQQGVKTLKARSATNQQTSLDAERAKCTAGLPSCNPALIKNFEAKLTRSGIVAGGGTPAEKCDGLGSIFKPTCWLRTISVTLGTLLISISAFVLAIADMLFNWAVDNTILLFQSAIFLRVEEGVNAGWTAMRDIANIVIIGMFTFIAISTILGIQEYGAKKLLARVLVIAVLINFSLLFTKIIIDASNFTASQFYASASGASLGQARDDAATRSSGARSTITITEDNKSSIDSFRTLGIGGAFIRFLGVTSVSKTYAGLDGVANADGDGGGWYLALAHGLLAAVLLGGAAGVLFYGAYLLISRAVLFIFLMITAAGAFATHLIPKMDDSKYGWNGWWSSLLHNAALAPILMILLWITLKVSASVTAVTTQNGGTLGNLASVSATKSTDISSLFSYLIILGLLFGSFKLASKWAGKVGGLKLTGTLLSSLPLGTAALASRFAVAPMARKFIGGHAAARSMVLGDEIKEHSKYAAGIDRTTEAGKKEYQKALDDITAKMKKQGKADKLAKSSFNAANLAQKGLKSLGVPSFLTGAAKSGGYAETAKERAEAAIKAAEKAALTKEDVLKGTGRENIHDSVMNDQSFMETLRRFRNAARDLRATADAARADRDDQSRALEQRRNDAQTAKTVAEERLATVNQQREVQQPLLVQLKIQKGNADAIVQQEEAKGATMDPNSAGFREQQEKIETARTNANAMRERVEAQQSEVNTLDQRARAESTAATRATNTIKETQDTIARLNKMVDETEKAAKQAEAKGQEEGYNEGAAIEREVEKRAQKIAERTKGIAVDAAAQHAHRRLSNLLNVYLGQSEDNDTIAKYTRKQAGSSAGIKYKEFRDAMNVVQGQLGTAGAPEATAPTPPPPPHTPEH